MTNEHICDKNKYRKMLTADLGRGFKGIPWKISQF